MSWLTVVARGEQGMQSSALVGGLTADIVISGDSNGGGRGDLP